MPAVVFDFDGVLADTERVHLAVTQDVYRDRGWSLSEADYFAEYLGYDDAELLKRFAADRGIVIDDDGIKAIVDEKFGRFHERLAGGDALYPGTRACVARVRERFQIAIASGAQHADIVAILRTGGLAGVFPVIVGIDDVEHGKPAPDPYEKAVTLLGVPPGEAVAVEDSRWGIASAREAGLRTIGVTTNYASTSLGGPDAVIGSLDELTIDLIERILGTPALGPRTGS